MTKMCYFALQPLTASHINLHALYCQKNIVIKISFMNKETGLSEAFLKCT